ncbi:DegV family protein [Apilactobacillus micheneri]|uniref:DegV family protein n=1 Tax=Apilactobacillus micheneri TaxID=1899430 RepID=A0ABY2YYA2_9LACO|nr:DegV family protein [Apilactobacillus micheneri]TPR25565.1 DegV family protein [Apilactobacillus micheneri]TPR26669.1 DegV family protein [Apilactobacillus micheneri]TPR28456.1 DegV family protein [Apilactobacillus micheneri]TPR29143.1 DegV family protein [Apilactobacillus micheneri]TPR30732.1 DegV family protein [Apilactobacillus micheneri]
MKIAIVTDSTSYLSKEEQEKYNINVVPIPVIIDGKSYNEGVDISTEEFYDKLRNSESFPSTSQPPMGEMINTYNKLADEGYDAVISIHLASTISGFYNSLVSLAPTIENIKVIPYNSKLTVKLMGNLAIEAAKMAQANQNIDDILSKMDEIRATINEVFVVDDLQNLVRGGRLSNASAFLGSLLKIKPLLTFDDKTNEIVAFEKVRSRKKALKRTEEIFKEAVSNADYPIKAMVINANDSESGDVWAKKIKEMYPDMTVEKSYFGPVIGTHLGEKALALGWMIDSDK